MTSPGLRYRSLRTALVLLRRIAYRYSINFDNAVESSAKDRLASYEGVGGRGGTRRWGWRVGWAPADGRSEGWVCGIRTRCPTRGDARAGCGRERAAAAAGARAGE